MENRAIDLTERTCPPRQHHETISSDVDMSWETRELLSALYKDYYKSLKKIVGRYRLSPMQVEDVLQETFLKAMLHLDTLQNRHAIFPWLCSIARNLCLLELRKARRFIAIESPVNEENERGGYHGALKAEDATASMKFEFSLTLLRGLIENHQHEVRRDVAHRFYVEEQSVKVISEECHMNQNTILSHLRRFRMIVSDAMLAAVEKYDLIQPAH